MLLINKTVSLCNTCYRHVPAFVYEKDEKILMTKKCLEHGESTSIVETDKTFYYNLIHHTDIPSLNALLFEVTDRCQLACPHCYHLPDNRTVDKPIEEIINQVKSFHISSAPMIAGAEPTLRSDLPEICKEISKMGFGYFDLLSNGIRFSDIKFTEKCYDNGMEWVCIGLNHPSYQGMKVHEKQLKGIENLVNVGCNIGYVGYTIQSLDEIPFILEEIKKLKHPKIRGYRIRCGSFIGRSNDIKRSFLSETVKYINNIIGNNLTSLNLDDNPYHTMNLWDNEITLRLIQWPDVTNIDMEELASGPWCNFVGGPITNFVHQVILRDAFKNNSLSQLDYAPSDYHYRDMINSPRPHWKENWNGPINISNFNWNDS
jgi:organic radical activating enzyme